MRLLLAAVLLTVIGVMIAHFRSQITSIHDRGFKSIYQKVETPEPKPPGKKIVSSDRQLMTLDPTGRFLINSFTKKPVFITGESPWSLITVLSDSEVETYLSDRAARGFNFIWCAAADNYYQPDAPKNYYGDVPFDGPDFTGENPKYWSHVDHVIERAAAYGITVALDPGFVGLNSKLGYLASYQASSGATLTDYGAYLGERYKGFTNIVWALGGDVDPDTGVTPKLVNLARGIRTRDSVHLIVVEGQPGHSALDTMGSTDWMDLNWLYFHTTNIPAGVAFNYARADWLPPFLGEGWYEREHSMTALQTREQAYWAILSGAYLGSAGFGNDPIWYFGAGPMAHKDGPSWQSQLGSPGSVGQANLGKLFRSREHWMLVPDVRHKVVTSGYDSRSLLSSIWEQARSVAHQEAYRPGALSSVAARTADGQTIMAYIPLGNVKTITVAMNQISDADSLAKCWWFNPRDGSSSLIGILGTRDSHRFTAPNAEDWVLVIDSFRANLSAPGAPDS